jgi:predicted DNA-binding protein
MDEKEFRATLSKEELEQRAFILSFKVTDIELFERLNQYSAELSKPYDYLINTALTRFFNDIDAIWSLRLRRN